MSVRMNRRYECGNADPDAPDRDQPVAIVTGSSGGIGKGIARALAQQGFLTYGFDNAPDSRSSADGAGGVRHRRTDVATPSEIGDAVEAVIDSHQRVDVLACCAGIKSKKSTLHTSVDEWRRTLEVNVTGVFFAVKAVLPVMMSARSGSIVLMGSPSGYAEPDALAYATSKGAILAFTRSLAFDCIGHGVRVNAIVPGTTRSGMTAGISDEQLAARHRQTVAGRLNEPTDIANLVRFLVGPDAATISGAVIEVGRVQGQMALARRDAPIDSALSQGLAR
ncbi:MAG: SDR family oxidoreductase [Ilumatobacteraceae bacterium]